MNGLVGSMCRLGCLVMAACAGLPIQAAPPLREASWFWGHEPGQVDNPGNSFKVPVGREKALSMTDAVQAFGVPGLSVIRYAAPGTNAAAVAEFASVPRLAWMASSCYSDNALNRAMANGAIEGAVRMRFLLGLYLWDFGGKRPVSDAEMKIQLDFALEKFRAGELDGVVFHCTPLVNKDLRAVALAKEWLDRHGDVRFGSAERSCAMIPGNQVISE